jgi:hypothetical protein
MFSHCYTANRKAGSLSYLSSVEDPIASHDECTQRSVMDPGVVLRVFRLHWSCACILLLPGSSANNNFPKHRNMPRSDSYTNGSKKRGTATEHAKQPAVMKPNAQTQQYMERAQADRANNTFEFLVSLLADFLIHVLQELCPRFAVQCEDVVFDKIAEWAVTAIEGGQSFYNESELLLHKKMWDVVKRDVLGVPKKHLFVQRCRRISMHCTKGDATNSASTENADNGNRFRRMAEDIFAHDLTPKQKKDPKYQLREGKTLSSKQRSLVNSILRKNMGDARIALYILDRSVPTLLDPPLLRKAPQTAQLQNMLHEFMMWHASLLRWLAEKETDPNTIIARQLSDLNLKQWQSERRRRKWEAHQELRQGAHLAELRDSNNKRFHDMSATEQRVLEDFDCGKLEKLHDDLRVLKPNHWG